MLYDVIMQMVYAGHVKHSLVKITFDGFVCSSCMFSNLGFFNFQFVGMPDDWLFLVFR